MNPSSRPLARSDSSAAPIPFPDSLALEVAARLGGDGLADALTAAFGFSTTGVALAALAAGFAFSTTAVALAALAVAFGFVTTGVAFAALGFSTTAIALAVGLGFATIAVALRTVAAAVTSAVALRAGFGFSTTAVAFAGSLVMVFATISSSSRRPPGPVIPFPCQQRSVLRGAG